MAEQTQQTCPYCGASLPAEASFCPRCARSVNQRQKVSPPSIRWRKALRRAFPALLLILILGGGGDRLVPVHPSPGLRRRRHGGGELHG